MILVRLIRLAGFWWRSSNLGHIYRSFPRSSGRNIKNYWPVVFYTYPETAKDN